MGTRHSRVLGIVVVGLLVVAIAAVVYAATRPVTTWSSGTPEGTVQAYLTAVIDRDVDTAATYLDPDGDCDVDDFDQVWLPRTARAELVGTHVDGDVARVEVDVAVSGGGPLDVPVPEAHTFRLTRSTGGGWLIAGTPWPLYDCRGVK
jgi:hypothetical protein